MIDNMYQDTCVKCKNPILYGLVIKDFEKANIVCRLFDNGLYFVSRTTYQWGQVNSLIQSGFDYVGQIKEIVDCTYDMYHTDDDLILPREHRRFSDKWVSKVMNPSFKFTGESSI